MSKYTRIGVCWRDEESGYITGKLDAKIYLFENKDKKTDRHPDFDVCVKQYEPKKEEEDGF